MTDFLEEALADIDSVFFQEFVEQHKIDGKPFDVVPYEMTLKERKAHWEAGAMQYDGICYTIRSCQTEHGLYLVELERVRQ